MDISISVIFTSMLLCENCGWGVYLSSLIVAAGCADFQ